MDEREMTLRQCFIHTLTAMKDLMETKVDRFTVRESDDCRTLLFEIKLEDTSFGIIHASAVPEQMLPEGEKER